MNKKRNVEPYDFVLHNILNSDEFEELENAVDYNQRVTNILLAAIYSKLQDLESS